MAEISINEILKVINLLLEDIDKIARDKFNKENADVIIRLKVQSVREQIGKLKSIINPF